MFITLANLSRFTNTIVAMFATKDELKSKVDLSDDGLTALVGKATTGTETPSGTDWYLSKYAANGNERVVKRNVSSLATYVRSTIPTATQSANGYISAADKKKLDNNDGGLFTTDSKGYIVLKG